MKCNISLLMFSFLLIASCSDNDDNDPKAIDPVAIEFEIISDGRVGNLDENAISPEAFLINNALSWNSLLNNLDLTNNNQDYPTINELSIDFDESSVIVIIDPYKTNCCYEFELLVMDKGDSIVVSVMRSSDFYVNFVLSQQYIMAKVPKTNLPIELQ